MINKIFFLIVWLSITLSSFAQSDTITNDWMENLIPNYIGLNRNFQTPFYIIEAPGTPDDKNPVMLIDACIHGDEIAGREACLELLEHIKLTKGTLIIIPTVNKLAFDMLTRLKTDDLNRRFPGRTNCIFQDFSKDCISDCDTALIKECIVGNEFMKLIETIKPNLVLNLHESRSFDIINKNRTYIENKEIENFNYGNTLITCPTESYIERDTNYLLPIQEKINKSLNPFYKFNVVRFGNRYWWGYSLDYIVYKNPLIKSFTIETYRNFNYLDASYSNNYIKIDKIKDLQYDDGSAFDHGYTLNDRVFLQLICCLSFMDNLGIHYSHKSFDTQEKYMKFLKNHLITPKIKRNNFKEAKTPNEFRHRDKTRTGETPR